LRRHRPHRGRSPPDEVRVFGKVLFEVEVLPQAVLGLTAAEYQIFFDLAARLWTALHPEQEDPQHE
jgi:hypothetical protein